MKSLVLIILAAILVVSFGFLDGWPFRSDSSRLPIAAETDEAETETDSETAAVVPGHQAVEKEDSLTSPAKARAEAAEVMEVREALAEARGQDLETRLRALSDTVLRFDLALAYRMEVLKELRQLAREQVLRGARGLETETVAVTSGDNLTRIARRVQRAHGGNVSPAMVMRLNGLRNDRIRVGQKLSVPTGRLEALVSKSDHRLYLVLDGIVVLDFPVGIGRENSTPEGSFRIINKTVNPTWRTPDGRLLEYGDPDHIIGNRWMGFADEAGPTSYGIHGTTEPDSIGQDESDGCVRMLEADVEEVFRLVPEGCPVRVLP